jgi:hypothetical protein
LKKIYIETAQINKLRGLTQRRKYMEPNELAKLSDEELVDRLPKLSTGNTQEMHNAERDQLSAELNRRSSVVMIKLTRAIYVLTVVLVIIGIIQLWTLLKSNSEEKKRMNNSDPLALFGKDNPALRDCLKKVNPKDPLGIMGENEMQSAERKTCIDKYNPPLK